MCRAAVRSPLVELPADVQRRIAAALAEPVHPHHVCHLASTCSTFHVALAEPLVAVRGEHEGITALCSQCGTTLGTLLREKPRALDWNGAGLAELHASALCSLIGSGALASVTDLHLWGNQIGDEGMKAFSAALATGALASIRFIDLDYNQATEMGKAAMRDVADARSFRVDLA